MTSTYSDRPWRSSFGVMPGGIQLEHPNVVSMLDTACAQPESPLIKYFGTELSVGETDALSDALAAGLLESGLAVGGRVALYLQNVPQFLITLLAIWKAGAIAVPVNPMLKERELEYVLNDSGSAVLIAHEALFAEVAAPVLKRTGVHTTLTTSELDFVADVQAPRALSQVDRHSGQGSTDLLEFCRAHHGGRRPRELPLQDSVALLSYTSGTTGRPKAAMNTHRNVSFSAQAQRDWFGLTMDDTILGLAPLFHITGMISACALALSARAPLVLGYRFEAKTVLELIERYRPTFAIGAITAYVALMNCREAPDYDLSSLTRVFSGGAPIPPHTASLLEDELGLRVHNAYGLTEATGVTHAVPFGAAPRVDVTSGALSIGVPYFDTGVRVVDERGLDVPVRGLGELVISGPQIAAGYWEKPKESAQAFQGNALFTGDIGFMDEDGWFYLVDRKKDMIIASGYKVWPREIEDVLYQHPGVREAAVIGVEDPYRGETVKAFVSLRPGEQFEPQELIEFCRDRLAAYKYPREIEVVDELPKSVSGKILRRDFRDVPRRASGGVPEQS